MKTIALHGSFSQNMVDCLQKKCPEGFELCAVSPENEAAALAKADYIVNRGAVVNEAVIAAAKPLTRCRKIFLFRWNLYNG